MTKEIKYSGIRCDFPGVDHEGLQVFFSFNFWRCGISDIFWRTESEISSILAFLTSILKKRLSAYVYGISLHFKWFFLWFCSDIKSLYLGPNPVKSFKEDFMKTLDITRLSLRNMSLTEVPASLSNLVLYIAMFSIYAVQRSTVYRATI